ncbi:hypothetical protein Q5P01_002849 [Channa striata]|uniref:Uncharacterized protein n=1 Tax=Channa striata TaxID=64152 RepID=A0AA88NNA1_CHASR|nr:hypothetical protein Q5P01_002849 [Channa striata]
MRTVNVDFNGFTFSLFTLSFRLAFVYWTPVEAQSQLRSKVKDSVVELVVDPNYSQTWTTEMPLQTPDPKEEMDDTGWPSRSRWIPVVVVFAVFVVLAVGGITVCLMRENHQKDELLETCWGKKTVKVKRCFQLMDSVDLHFESATLGAKKTLPDL